LEAPGDLPDLQRVASAALVDEGVGGKHYSRATGVAELGPVFPERLLYL